MSIRAHETPPKPVETNMSHTDKRLWKKLAGAFKLLQGFGGYTRGCASTPPWNSTTTRKEECSISKLQPLRVPNRYHCRVSGATIGDNYKGHLITGETPLSKNNKKQKTNLQTPKNTLRMVAAQSRRAHGPESHNGPPSGRSRYPLGESLSRSRTRYHATKSPTRSRA
jgi:hypothetical protein